MTKSSGIPLIIVVYVFAIIFRIKIFDSLHAAKIIPIRIPNSKDEALTRTVISAPISISSPHPDEPKENTSNIFIYIKKNG